LNASTSPTLDLVPRLDSSAARKHLLIIKFGAIGDVVMAIPAAAAMHASGYQVDWVASEAVAPVLRLYPWIHVIAVDEPRLLRGSNRERLSGMLSLWRLLRKRTAAQGAYDVCATLYYDRRYELLSLPVRAARKFTLSRTDRRYTLLAGRHHADEYHRILSDRPDQETSSQIAPVPLSNLPPTSRPAIPGRPRVVLVPAGARNVLRDDALRRWPIEYYVVLAQALLAQGCEVLLVGGPDDRWASASFRPLAALSEPFADLIGQLSLVESLALLDSSAVTVVHDTGPLHLAGITSTAIVTIFGPTDPHGRLPQRPDAVAIWGGEGFACRPCYDGRDYAPCPHNGCMAQVTPPMVLTQVNWLLRARAERRSLPPRVLTPSHAGLVQLSPGGAA
jgi:heptosyltransferase-2